MESKPWYLSKTIWGLIVLALAQLVNWKWGVTITDQGQVTNDALDLVTRVAELIGAGLAAYGRLKVNTKLTARKAA